MPPFALRITFCSARSLAGGAGRERVDQDQDQGQSINQSIMALGWSGSAQRLKKKKYHTSESLYPATRRRVITKKKKKRIIIFPFLIHFLFFFFFFFFSYLRHGIYLVYPGRREKTTRFSLQTADCGLPVWCDSDSDSDKYCGKKSEEVMKEREKLCGLNFEAPGLWY